MKEKRKFWFDFDYPYDYRSAEDEKKLEKELERRRNMIVQPSSKKDVSVPTPSKTYTRGSNFWLNSRQNKTGFLDKLNKSDTLVIHCYDRTTTMLSQIYEGKGWDVVNDGCIADEELRELIRSHDRIVMLGHGTPGGLINVQAGGSIINSSHADLLKDKKLFVIWCKADEFFRRNNIGKGQFITGNIPSEVWECRAAGCGDISAELMLENITYWSKLCADVVETALNGNPQAAVDYVRENYLERYGDHPVTHYNAERTQVLN